MTDFLTEYREAVEDAEAERQKAKAKINIPKYSGRKIRRR